MSRELWETARNRVVASDPGLVRLRLAGSAVLGIVLAVGALMPFGLPLTILMVAAIAAMMTAFTVSDKTPGQQAVTLVLCVVVGGCSVTVASLGMHTRPLDTIVFVLLIFLAVYAQRFGPRAIALGTIAFFLFFFSMFLQTRPAQIPTVLLALSTGVAANAVVRFVLLRRNSERELLRIRRAFRARLAATIRAVETYLATGGTDRASKQLRRADARLHESVLMIEDAADDLLDDRAAALLRRRAVEVELATQWLEITVRRTCTEELPPSLATELADELRRLRSLIERDPRDLPVISDTEAYSAMLVKGSKLGAEPAPGDELRRAIAELAVADVHAQRVAERDFSGEEPQPEPKDDDEPTPLFAYDNQARNAIQATVGGGLAVLGGELVSHQRWYWAVLTVFVVFVGTSSAGATFVKGARRVGGTLLGIVGGVALTLLVSGNTPATLGLILVCVFGMVYMSRLSQTLMAVFITTMLGLLYSLLGTFSFEVLWIRVAETAVGAAAGLVAALLVAPVRTRDAMLADLEELLTDLREFLDRARALLLDADTASLIELSRQLDRDVEQVRTTVEPLTHPINVRSARRDYGWYVLTSLETVAFRARHVAARAEPGLFAGDDHLPGLLDRIRRNVDVLLDVAGAPQTAGGRLLRRGGGAPTGDRYADPRQRGVLASLERLSAGLLALGKAFGVPVTEVQAGAGHAEDHSARTHPVEHGRAG